MSKAEQADTSRPDPTELVYLSRRGDTDKHYHKSATCHNLPVEHRQVKFGKIDGHYDACSYCADGDPGGNRNSNQAKYECKSCEQEKRLGVTGVRTLHACHKCDDITTWERLHDVR